MGNTTCSEVFETWDNLWSVGDNVGFLAFVHIWLVWCVDLSRLSFIWHGVQNNTSKLEGLVTQISLLFCNILYCCAGFGVGRCGQIAAS